MAKTDDFDAKLTVICLNGTSLTLTKVAPANSHELREMKELDSMGLAKFLVVDTSASFIAHKGIEKSLLHDLSSSDDVLTEIVERSRSGPSLVQIHASKIWLCKIELTPSQYQERAREEDSSLANDKRKQ